MAILQSIQNASDEYGENSVKIGPVDPKIICLKRLF